MTDVAKLRALLTEARNELGTLDALTLHPNVDSETDGLIQLLRRIDEALAESDVRWNNPMLSGSLKHTAMVNGYYIVVEPSTTGVSWAAYPQHQSHKGEFLSKKTMEEAKEAALTAVGWRKP